jgi:cyclopropane-fatty-acyl-phospholipid synthase
MRYALDAILGRLIVHGRLTVRWPDGRVTSYGSQSGPRAAIHLTTRRSVRALLLNPALAAGELYMDRSIMLEDGGIFELLDVFMTNIAANRSANPMIRPRNAFRVLRRRVDQYNPISRSMTNVAHHYDLNCRLYSLFLDRDLQYSCGYFRTGHETLEAAQVAKKRHIAAKLCLDRPDLTVLDIGCGWGGMALTLARDFGARVTGITLSHEQLTEARARAEREGLAERVTFELLDYRTLDRSFDRIVSVGMFEHVGVNHFRTFFNLVSRCLGPDGVALIHAIGRAHGPGATNPWIAKYIFPGGYCPALSEVMPSVEKSGLLVADIEILRLHYAETLRHWRWRFAANRDTIGTLYDDRFCRMFEFYLAAAELSFRREDQMVFQLQLAHRIDAVPLTRDYIAHTEALAEPSPMSPLSTA